MNEVRKKSESAVVEGVGEIEERCKEIISEFVRETWDVKRMCNNEGKIYDQMIE